MIKIPLKGIEVEEIDVLILIEIEDHTRIVGGYLRTCHAGGESQIIVQVNYAVAVGDFGNVTDQALDPAW